MTVQQLLAITARVSSSSLRVSIPSQNVVAVMEMTVHRLSVLEATVASVSSSTCQYSITERCLQCDGDDC